jgi:hypothetical protein
MPVESIALNTHFGVELFQQESSRTAAHLVCASAHEAKTLFHRIEILDTILFGGRRFARMRSDLLNPFPMLDLIFARGRATIGPAESGYEARFPDGRKGPVPNMIMHSTPKPGQRAMYRGPKVKLWPRQFD